VVRSGINFLEGFDRNFRINLGGVEAGVAEELLDQADVGAVFQHVGGAAVTEEVATAALADVGGFDGLGHPVADVAAKVRHRRKTCRWIGRYDAILQADKHVKEPTEKQGVGSACPAVALAK